MAKNLLESYAKRIALAESIHKKSHNGAAMSAQKKVALAAMLENTSKFMNEAFETSAATQRSAMGDYKRFCLNITNLAVPNLILPEIMLVQPMTSIAGYVTYVKYSAGIDKGGVKVNDLFNSPYHMGKMDDDRALYTSDTISESHTVVDGDIVDGVSRSFTLDWAPVLGIKKLMIGDTHYSVVAAGSEVIDESVSFDTNTGKVSFNKDDKKFIAGAVVKVLYIYDNVIIPQQETPTSLPTLKASMASVDLHAHARRIAIYYSQIAAFQASNDYGFDMGQQLAAQAQGELQYEIDTEGVKLLSEGAEIDKSLNFEKYKDDKAISRSQYYEEFSEIIARAKAIIYKRTQKFAPNYMVCGANVLTILPFVKGWTPAPAAVVNGPYFAGTVDSLKVFVSPALADGEFFFGVNGNDLQTSAAVYAPYMAVVPTQLLGLPDGTMTQGFSTMYDMKLLSTYNKVGDEVVDTKEGEVGKYSYLLVKGNLLDTNANNLNVKVNS